MRPGGGAIVTGFGTALPGAALEQPEVWERCFAGHFTDDRVAGRIFRGAGVRRRHAAVNPMAEDVSGWSTGDRMRRYGVEALPLGKEAVGAALADAGLRPEDVGQFAVVSCTGYATPGLDIRIAADLGMAPHLQRLVVGHMGCYAAIPGLGAVSDYVVARGRPALLLCCELTSLHVQPRSDDLGQAVSHALFGDAAVAVVVEPGQRPGREAPGLEVVDVAAVTDPATADHMTWDVTDLGFRMGLSPEVPRVLGRHVRGMVTGLLGRHGLAIGDVDGWAVHPGGPKILDTVAERLDLPGDALDASRGVLAERGNCSSATVLMVLDALRDAGRPRRSRTVVAMAFGPGLTLYAALLRAR
ncbi:MAG: type III polyketide synthase [Pseudonocardia sp.]|nr:type III polyketide synthase [Pseudonocardia sp.]